MCNRVFVAFYYNVHGAACAAATCHGSSHCEHGLTFQTGLRYSMNQERFLQSDLSLDPTLLFCFATQSP